MSKQFPHLFTPLKLCHKTLKNRIVFGAHTANMSEGGLPVERHFGYYRERARGGAAMIVVEPAPAHRTGVLTRGNFRHEDDSVIPHFRRITDECHTHGTVMVHQIYHIGGHGDQDNSWEPYWSPSGVPSMHDPWGSHAMTEAEIEELIASFVEAARRDRDSGFDGVDLFAGYNCLIDQFWSPITNRRDDCWGGSLDNRMRFAVEVCRRIRDMAGDGFILGMTVSGAEPYPDGLTIEDKQEMAAYLDQRGLVDYFSVGTGSYLNQFSKIVPSFQFDMMLGPPDAQKFKQAVKHAVVTAEARVKTPANAEQVIAGGMADLVSIVRGQIADPHLANKARDGRAADVRPCVNCNQLCIGRRMRDYWISCLVNPSVGREFEWDGDRSPAAETARDILVVGGGPAGLETARVAAERGHRVTVVERGGELAPLALGLSEGPAACGALARRRSGQCLNRPRRARRHGGAGNARAPVGRSQRLVAGQRHRAPPRAAAPPGDAGDQRREGSGAARTQRHRRYDARALHEIRHRDACGDSFVVLAGQHRQAGQPLHRRRGRARVRFAGAGHHQHAGRRADGRARGLAARDPRHRRHGLGAHGGDGHLRGPQARPAALAGALADTLDAEHAADKPRPGRYPQSLFDAVILSQPVSLQTVIAANEVLP